MFLSEAYKTFIIRKYGRKPCRDLATVPVEPVCLAGAGTVLCRRPRPGLMSGLRAVEAAAPARLQAQSPPNRPAKIQISKILPC